MPTECGRGADHGEQHRDAGCAARREDDEGERGERATAHRPGDAGREPVQIERDGSELDELGRRLVAELEQAEAGIRDQLAALERELDAIVAIIEQPELLPLAANG